MTSTMTKIQLAVYIIVVLVLGLIWAINGYDDTWLYVIAAIIAIPTSWLYWGKKEQK